MSPLLSFHISFLFRPSVFFLIVDSKTALPLHSPTKSSAWAARIPTATETVCCRTHSTARTYQKVGFSKWFLSGAATSADQIEEPFLKMGRVWATGTCFARIKVINEVDYPDEENGERALYVQSDGLCFFQDALGLCFFPESGFPPISPLAGNGIPSRQGRLHQDGHITVYLHTGVD